MDEEQPPTPENSKPAERIVRRLYKPISPAAAILYPERQVKEWRWQDPTPLQQLPETPSYQASSSYNDIWTSDQEICAYCAHELAYDDVRCPHCRRDLSSSEFRYPRPSVNLHIYWVLVLGLGQLFLIQLMLDIIVQIGVSWIMLDGLVMGSLFALTLAIYWRQFWAYALSIVLLIVVSLYIVTNVVTGGPAAGLIQDDVITVAAAGNLTSFASASLFGFFYVFQMVAALLGLFYAIFKAGPDFERVKIRHVAEVKKGLREANEFYVVGKAYAQKGMWASAILHWQRAAANDPVQSHYQRVLGQAYALLGFYGRSLDMLQSAHKSTVDPVAKAELEQLIKAVRQQQTSPRKEINSA